VNWSTINIAEARPFGPLQPDHPLVTNATECPSCGEAFLAGERPTLVIDEQAPANVEARLAAGVEVKDDGNLTGAYTAEAIAVHWTCLKMAERIAEVVAS
jgi:hypothetical protein